MARRKLKSEAEAREALAAVSASGLSGVDWAAANGVDARSLHGWRLSLQRKDRALAEEAPLRLVEWVVPPAEAALARRVLEAREAYDRVRVVHRDPEVLRLALVEMAQKLAERLRGSGVPAAPGSG